MDLENEETPKGKSFPWGPALGLVALGAVGVVGFAMSRNRPAPEPEPAVTITPRRKPVVTEEPERNPKPAPVYVDIRSLTVDAKRDEADAPTAPLTPRVATPRPAAPRPAAPRAAAPRTATPHASATPPTPRPAAPEPAADVPTTVAKGTGVIAVKRGGKATVARVARVAEKPVDPSSATGADDSPKDPAAPAAPTTKPAAAPRVYGAEASKDKPDAAEPQVPFQHRKRGVPQQAAPSAAADPQYFSGANAK
jgi:translation initiation factor IF-2